VIELTRTAVKFGGAALLAALAAAAVAQGQPAPAPAPADPAPAPAAPAAPPPAAASVDVFNIPDNVKILGRGELGSRKATATVNGTLITGTDIDQRVALIVAASGAQQPPTPAEMQQLRLTVLRQLIDETLQIQEAKSLELEVTKDEIDESYNRIAADRFNMSPDALGRFLAQAGSSEQSLRRQVEGQLAWDRILRRNVAPFVNVSAGEVNELHERLQASRGTTEFRVAEIFLSATPATHDTVAQNARRIVEQIRNGASFAAYARQFSEASTAAVGGDLNWIKLEQLQNAELEGVVGQMNPGQMVGPLEVPGGFDILYLIDKRQVGMADPRDAVLSLKQISIDFPAGTSEADARTRIAAFQQGVQQIRGCGDAEAAGARIGAEVVANDQIRVRDLPDALQNLLLQLQVGQATPAFGDPKEGVRVLMLCGRDDPQVNNGPTVDQLMAQLQDDRIQKRAQRYLRDLRRDAVIEYN
jgi:peptidyl-prolyl cis-trans isomerase SurA